MINKSIVFAGMLVATCGAAQAQETHVFKNPCDRGPFPRVSIINDSKSKFVNFLLQIRPEMSSATAQFIAYRLCDDMSLVHNSEGLTQRLNLLLQEYSD